MPIISDHGCPSQSPPQGAHPPPPPFTLAPAPPPALADALGGWAIAFSTNGLMLDRAMKAAEVEPGGSCALEDGVDLDGAFFDFLQKPGITETYGSPTEAAAAFGEEELDLSPEAAQRFAASLTAIVADRIRPTEGPEASRS